MLDPTREQLDQCLLDRSDHENHYQGFNVAKTVVRFSFGLTKKDDTGIVIDRFVERIEGSSSSGFFDDNTKGTGGVYDVYACNSI